MPSDKGASALRNARDWAEKRREDFMRAANYKALNAVHSGLDSSKGSMCRGHPTNLLSENQRHRLMSLLWALIQCLMQGLSRSSSEVFPHRTVKSTVKEATLWQQKCWHTLRRFTENVLPGTIKTRTWEKGRAMRSRLSYNRAGRCAGDNPPYHRRTRKGFGIRRLPAALIVLASY
jgi:hypothetical protein